MFLHVTSATPVDGFRVRVRFENGREGVADLTEALIGPMLEPLKDPEKLRTLRIDEELRTIVWPNGAGLAPKFTYFQTFRDHPELPTTFRKWGCVI